MELEKEKKKTTVVNGPAADAVEEVSGNKEPSGSIVLRGMPSRSTDIPSVGSLVLLSELRRNPSSPDNVDGRASVDQ